MSIVKRFVNNFLCATLGHNKLRIILAYRINTYSMSIGVEIYEIGICLRCNCILVHKIDKYERCSWYASQLAKTAEDILRKQGLVTIAEAYKELRS